jgi:hypothetical protein
VRYTLDVPPVVRTYLAGLSLSRQGRIGLALALSDLRDIPDAFRLDPLNRSGPHFAFLRVFRDAGRLRLLRLMVDDSPAVFSVLRVVYADLN